MTDLLLIQPPNVEGTLFNLPGVEIPLSIMTVSAYLKQNGYKTEVMDLTLEKNSKEALRRRLIQNPPNAVGITSYTTNIGIAARIAERIKHYWPQTPVVAGGFHPSALPKQTLEEYPVFDVLVHGEGEETMLDLMDHWGRSDTIRDLDGIAWADESGNIHVNPARPLMRHLDELPFPDREGVPIHRYVPDVGNYYTLPTTGILYSRGCPCPCTFCSKSVFLNSVRYRSPDNFIQELKYCQERWGVNDFRLFDEGPTIRRKMMEEMCHAILDNDLQVTWNCFSRVDVVDEELLSLMKKAGCYHVIYGVETVVPESQKRVRKRVSPEKIKEACRLTRKAGIECKANFILGFPWESEQDIEDNVQFALNLDADLISVNLFKPMPGSPLYDEMVAAGQVKKLPWDKFFVTSDSKLFDSQISEERQKKILKAAWMRFYFSRKNVARRLERIWRDPLHETIFVAKGVWILLQNLVR
ncbi:MAG: cobalamin B12-binding domain-containing protein [Deltaproteobacteria bacterium]|nr:cobalamin-dependent protein [bacterium]MCB9476601.1 cobalamin B12-binding domain-containing protein [Deltaproteobacteria bacterium]MCB9487980.1 cobalamin B12-binding domain-containing protein [Deltaproteobacteria bacterium]